MERMEANSHVVPPSSTPELTRPLLILLFLMPGVLNPDEP